MRDQFILPFANGGNINIAYPHITEIRKYLRVDQKLLVCQSRGLEMHTAIIHVVCYDEIKDNDFNLNIPRYVDTFEEEELVDIDEVKKNIAAIEAELAQVQAQMAKYLEELGL